MYMGLIMKKLFTPLLLATVVLTAHSAQAASVYAQTKYPLVLVHGLFGWGQLVTTTGSEAAASNDYFYQIPADLRANGATVFTPAVSPVDSTEVRGEQLLAQVNTILAITGAAKVNLIGHSQGGPTSRYVAGVAPSKVASVSTIAGTHKGSSVADLVVALQGVPVLGSLADSVLAGLAGLTGNGSASMASISTAGSAKFTSRFPDGVPTTACGEGAYTSANGQRFYSWSGTSVLTNFFDPSDYFLSLTSLAFMGQPNDGLMERCSSHFGQVLRDNYPWNHLDEVNLFNAQIGWFFTPDPKEVIRTHANRLKTAGL
jgi:triacylglycerol lipase